MVVQIQLFTHFAGKYAELKSVLPTLNLPPNYAQTAQDLTEEIPQFVKYCWEDIPKDNQPDVLVVLLDQLRA